MIRSVGRLDVIVDDLLFELAASGARLSAEQTLQCPDFPLSLRPTQTHEQYVSSRSLARAANRYGGAYEWRAAPVISGEIATWSDTCFVTHPSEPALQDQLEDLNSSLLWPLWQRLYVSPTQVAEGRRKSFSAAELEEMTTTHAEVGDQLWKLRERYDAADQGVRAPVTIMLVSAEEKHAETRDLINEQRRTGPLEL
jgi:hypothetical protein